MNIIIAIQPKWCKRFPGTSQVVHTMLKRPSENTVPVDSVPLLLNLVPVGSMSVSYFFQNSGWWVFATFPSSWKFYCGPDGAPGSANPTNRYVIV